MIRPIAWVEIETETETESVKTSSRFCWRQRRFHKPQRRRRTQRSDPRNQRSLDKSGSMRIPTGKELGFR
ncbi:hypothetical protein HanPI659440_Chr08g0287711 [Helianthus annuus]|nr:hypothetical protein HanPI659440_Chr08g0287711 [Helianthus annuus]